MAARHTMTVMILAGLILGSFRGRLALWTDASPLPVRIYSCCITMLPAEDQQRLGHGIPIESGSKLHRLLEDYLS